MSIIGPVSVPGSSFPVSPMLTGIAIGYRNPENYYVADTLCPRLPPMGSKAFEYTVFDTANSITTGDGLVGPQSEPDQVEIGGSAVQAKTSDYGFDSPIPVDEQMAYEKMVELGLATPDPQVYRTQALVDRLDLVREIRVANMFQNPANYDPALVNDLSLSTPISNYANSDPIKLVQTAMDSTLIYRPNTAWFSRQTWSVFRSHPRIVKAINRTAGDTGIITAEQVANLFELKRVVIGDSFVNGAKPGQAVNARRVWGNCFGLAYINPVAQLGVDATFAFTYQFLTRMAGAMAEPKKGLRGTTIVRVGESLKEVVAAKEVAVLFENAT
jgi:hypothetical protein